MSDGRSLQVKFSNLIGAARFKTFDGARLVRARCPQGGCNQVDTRGHFLRCYGVRSVEGYRIAL